MEWFGNNVIILAIVGMHQHSFHESNCWFAFQAINSSIQSATVRNLLIEMKANSVNFKTHARFAKTENVCLAKWIIFHIVNNGIKNNFKLK